MLKFVSWNVNGLRAAVKKGFLEAMANLNSDFICLQEIKLSAGQLELEMPGYLQFYHYAERKGYSGTAIFAKYKPLSVSCGIGKEEHDSEGRVITLEYPNFYLVTVYTPNSKNKLERLPYREIWEDEFLAYLQTLEAKKPVIFCGDLNVAHQEIDLANPKSNRKSAGFTDQERAKFVQLLENGFIDTYRHFYPDKTEVYSWWSNFAKSRERNVGWRIDYFMVSSALKKDLHDAQIHMQVLGSDHCPVEVEVNYELPKELKVAENMANLACDASDEKAVEALLQSVR